MALPLPLPLKIYAQLATWLAPLAPRLLEKRAQRGKEDRARMGERFGAAPKPRPDGRLIWLHGASVGETISFLPLVESLTGRGLSVLVTSGTVTSAAVMEKRLPAAAFHQYIPLDAPPFIRKFLDHWRPDCALFAESEIWPNLIIETHARDIPVMIVNGRMSERSFQRWKKTPAIIRALLSRVDLCLAQSGDDAFRFGALGAADVRMPGNLKYDGALPPADPMAMAELSAAVSSRPLWLAASTHRGEDEIVFAAHKNVAQRLPDLLTIVVPRHPERGRDIAVLAQSLDLAVARRSGGEKITPASAVYVADTIGEMGIFYRLAPLVFMGGSLIAHGGQNPIEPAKLSAAVLHGPHMFNFAEAAALLHDHGGAMEVENGEALAQAVGALLFDPARMRAMGQAAHAIMRRQAGATERTMQAIADRLSARARDKENQREQA